MVEKFDERIDKYDGEAAHDTTGLGDVIDDYLRHDAHGNVMVGRTRSGMLSALITSIEHGEYSSPFIESLFRDVVYATVDDVWGKGHLPDGLSALSNGHVLVGREAEEDDNPLDGYRG